MTDHPDEAGVRRLPGSGWRRDRQETGRRPKSIRVGVTTEEHAVLEVLAANAGVSIPKLLIESAHAAARGGQTVSQHREQLYELVAIRRLLANVANNVNQIAKAANSGGLDGVEDQARAVFATVRRVADRIMDVVDEGTAR
ncbi:plasmid mobilization protein [Micromonospora sp.]|uniref:plasmid mobilization protein n=1 Tax=Micromonospora sp. TaxID=1876 RepID=UPI003B3AEEC7